jgi:FkbM family methyltransferase
MGVSLGKLRPAKVRSALRRRWFEYQVPRTELRSLPGLVELGSSYGSWILPVGLIESSWTCYMVGAGGDVTVDLALAGGYGVTVRAFDPVAEYVEAARADGKGEPRFSVHQAAIAVRDGPIRMQVTHHPGSQSVSAAQLYDTHSFIELPGRTLPSLMAEFGDEQIDLLKIDVEGSEYELMPTLDLPGLGVKVFAIQLHHNRSVAEARGLIAKVRDDGYDAVACLSPAKFTFVRRDLI